MASRRKNLKREPLDPERIARAALTYIDKHGLDAMSVRNLGATLSVEGMALYKHYASKEAILDAVAELLILELVVPAPTSAGWKARALQVGADYRAISRRHPKAFPLLGMRRFTTPRSLALLDRIFFALRADGLDAQQAVEVYRGVANWSNGSILDELAGIELAAKKLPKVEIPRELTALAEAQPYLGSDSFDESFATGLEALLSGLERNFTQKKKGR